MDGLQEVTDLRMRIHVPRSYSALFWLYCFVIGVVVGLVAFSVNVLVSLFFKGVLHHLVLGLVESPSVQSIKIILYILSDLGAVLVGTVLVVYVAPLAAGSGIPNMFAYLNGVDMPLFFTMRVAVVKVVGSVLVVSGGLAIGKEGSLLHIGSIVAMYLGGTRVFRSLRKTRDQDPFTYEQHARDLVACGAAAGLAAGFKAPVGGMLFAYEMASRWRPELTWRTLFTCAVVATVVKVGVEMDNASDFLSYGSLLFFADSISFQSSFLQVHWVALLGAIGGLVGCFFTSINTHIGGIRWRYKSMALMRILEAAVLCLLTSALRLSLSFLGSCLDKQQAGPCPEGEVCEFVAPGVPDLQSFEFYGCPKGTYNDLAVLMHNPQGYVVKALFTTSSSGFHMVSLAVFGTFYFVMAAVTYGIAVPAGLFTPSVIIGGTLGQLYAQCINFLFHQDLDVGLYAFLGAGAVLGGIFRFAVSFVVILTELTATEGQLPLLMLVVIIAKGIGDRFNQNILNHLCILLGLPYVGGHPESTIKRKGFAAKDVMNRTPYTFNIRESPSLIRRALSADPRGVFPVMNRSGECPKFVGFVEANDLRILLNHQYQPPTDEESANLLGGEGMDEDSPLDLSTITKMPPVVIPSDMPLTSLYRLKLSTGLEYIPVVDEHGPLRGVITRSVLLNCQNQHIDPDRIQEQLDIWTDEPYDDRANYEQMLSFTVSSSKRPVF